MKAWRQSEWTITGKRRRSEDGSYGLRIFALADSGNDGYIHTFDGASFGRLLRVLYLLVVMLLTLSY